eukprot:g4334.t1
MGTTPREIEHRALKQIELLLEPMLRIQKLPELAADFAVQPINKRHSCSDQWLPIQLKSSEAADVDGWLRQIRFQVTHRLAAYHGSVVLGWSSRFSKVLVLPVHRLRAVSELDLQATHWWVHPSALARTLFKHWKEMGFHTSTSLQLLATTSRNALMEGTLRAAFAGTFFEPSQRFKYEANTAEFTDVDGFLICLKTGAKLRCQEKAGKPKTRGGGETIGLTISTSRKGGCGYLASRVDVLVVHVRKSMVMPYGLRGCYMIPVHILAEKGYAPVENGDGSEKNWVKTLNLYPATEYLENPIRTWADEFYHESRDIPNAVEKIFNDFKVAESTEGTSCALPDDSGGPETTSASGIGPTLRGRSHDFELGATGLMHQEGISEI